MSQFVLCAFVLLLFWFGKVIISQCFSGVTEMVADKGHFVFDHPIPFYIFFKNYNRLNPF